MAADTSGARPRWSDEIAPACRTQWYPAHPDQRAWAKGIITAILHVAYPNRYGVWNTTSDGALVELGLMPPQFERGHSVRRTVCGHQPGTPGSRGKPSKPISGRSIALWWALTAEEEGIRPESPSSIINSQAVNLRTKPIFCAGEDPTGLSFRSLGRNALGERLGPLHAPR